MCIAQDQTCAVQLGEPGFNLLRGWRVVWEDLCADEAWITPKAPLIVSLRNETDEEEAGLDSEVADRFVLPEVRLDRSDASHLLGLPVMVLAVTIGADGDEI